MQSKLEQAQHSEPDISCNKLYANGPQAWWHGTGPDADAFSRDMVMEGKTSSFLPPFADYRQAVQLRKEEEATTEKGPYLQFSWILILILWRNVLTPFQVTKGNLS